MKVNLVKEKGWHLLVNLFKQANTDKIISFDEQRIISATDLNVNKLVLYAKTAWEDSILTEDEKKRMSFLLKKIEDDAVSLAMYDDIITREEEDLLKIIKATVEHFFEEEQIYQYAKAS